MAIRFRLFITCSTNTWKEPDAALMPAIKRRDNALRQLEHWRDGLGLKACRLSNLFIAAARNGAAGQRA